MAELTNDLDYSPEAAAMLALLGKDELYEVTQTEFDLYCELQGIAGDRRWALEDERAAYMLPPDDDIRDAYLPDPATDIHWGWLLLWRNKLEWASSKKPRAHALALIQMLGRCEEKVPADVRRAAREFLAALAQAKPNDPIPTITTPDAAKWKTMSDQELYRRLDALRELLANKARRRHGSE